MLNNRKHKKLCKFIQRLNKMVLTLHDNRFNIVIHREVDQFYYMVKTEQLKELAKQFEDALKRLQALEEKIEMQYDEVYCRWQKDVRWLAFHLHFSKMDKKES